LGCPAFLGCNPCLILEFTSRQCWGKGDQDHQRHPDPGPLIQHLPRKHAGSPSSHHQRGIHHPLGEVQPRSITRLPVPGVPVEHSASVSGHPPNEGGRPSFSSQDPLQLERPHLSTSDGVDRPHRGLLQSSPSSSVERKVASNKSELDLLFRSRSSEDSDSLSTGQERSSVDHQSITISVLRPPVVPVPRSLRPSGPNGRVKPRLRHLVPRFPSPRPVGQHNCVSPYQCFGDHCLMAFPGLHPPKVVKAMQHPVEDRQHHGPSLRQEGRGYVQSASPSREGAGVGAPDVCPHTSGLHPHQGKHPSRCSISFLRDSRLASSSLCVPGDRGQMGSPHDRPLRQQRLQADKASTPGTPSTTQKE
jgi:hypothetical protein